jgi:hypothetical protein
MVDVLIGHRKDSRQERDTGWCHFVVRKSKKGGQRETQRDKKRG